jgi:DNA (cytosine-5)-methyltransferase 1
MKILELFNGYGTASFALKRLQIPYELVGYSDIDKYANQCFKQNHCPDDIDDKLRLGDVTKINPNELPDFDLLTGGFPCQAFSVAGKRLGELDPRGTLFYEIIRIAEVKQPKYMLLENVKGLTNKSFEKTFRKILSEIRRIGYEVYFKILNTKDFGIPQNRERIWFVCFRKDLSQAEFNGFHFPQPEPLKLCIKDILEENVDKKFYLSEKMQERFEKYLNEQHNTNSRYSTFIPLSKFGEAHRIYNDDGISPPVKHSAMNVNILGNIFSKGQNGLIYDKETCSPSLIKGTIIKIQDKIITKAIIEESPKPKGNYLPRERVIDENGIFRAISCTPSQQPMISNSVTTAFGRKGCSREELESVARNMYSGKLRRLTPKECFRLQGFLNDEVNLTGISDTQCYKLAGNGQSVNVVERIFKEMFKDEQKTSN